LLRQRFLDGMSRAACTVSIVTTDGPAGRAGVTVSAMSSVSADTVAPSLLVCVNQQSSAAAAIQSNLVFCVNLLRRDQAALSDRFARRGLSPTGDKFEGIGWCRLATGAPVLAGILAAFDCRLRRSVLYGTHWIFIGEVEDILLAAEPHLPLLYQNRSYGEPLSFGDAPPPARSGE
jgi:flavin reductase (DIM6/NTAB) family NADH-FMN oxidoreductase RutF